MAFRWQTTTTILRSLGRAAALHRHRSGQTPRALTSIGTLDLAPETPEDRIVMQKQRHRNLLSAYSRTRSSR
jgi:hypothetical protein